ncbi:LysR family transcriptional regulator [Holzapfeliella sp. He02]|uniref:LysR family transcriptional regulator n=1 Tax=Holzapfeliella saturejae TaxID=3082953 RepID=A0ABU8SIA3_9LACO
MKTKTDAVLSAKSLKYFLQLIDSMSYTQASQILGITQPALTQQIKKIERAVGAPLFGQIGKKLYLTDAGTRMQTVANDLFNTVNAAVDEIQQNSDSKIGTISIGILESLESTIFEDFVIDFSKQYPDLKLNIWNSSRRELWNRLDKNEVDIVIMPLIKENVSHWQSYNVKTMYEDELIYLSHHNLSDSQDAQGNIALESTLGHPLVQYPNDAYFAKKLAMQYRMNDLIKPESDIYFSSPSQLMQFAEKTNYDTFVPKSVCMTHPDNEMNHYSLGENLKIETSIIFRNEKYQIPRIKNFIDSFEKFLAKQSYFSRLEEKYKK